MDVCSNAAEEINVIADQRVAAVIAQLMLEYGAKLDESVAKVQSVCTEDELNEYKQVVGKIMGLMLTDVMNPIFKTHPALKPSELT